MAYRGAATVWFYGGKRGRYASRLLNAARQARAAGRGMWGACNTGRNFVVRPPDPHRFDGNQDGRGCEGP
jgi:endonuclease YncB( thermonuclease family)